MKVLQNFYLALKMFHLHTSSKETNNNKHLYYSIPKMTCEKFINKKGVERKDIFESRSTFISRAIKLAETLVTLRNKNF